jgi:hypothetical protein
MAQAFLAAGFPGAAKVHDLILDTASSTVTAGTRSIEKAREAAETIAELRARVAALETVLRERGVTVTAMASSHAEAAASASVDLRLQVSTAVQEALRTIDGSGLDAATKERLKQAGVEVIEAAGSGDRSFMDRAKSFLKDVADVVKTGAEIAAPLAPIVAKLVPLLV